MGETTNAVGHNLNALRGYPYYLNKAEIRGAEQKFRIQITNDKPVNVGDKCLLGIHEYEVLEIEIFRKAKGDFGLDPVPNFYSLICKKLPPIEIKK